MFECKSLIKGDLYSIFSSALDVFKNNKIRRKKVFFPSKWENSTVKVGWRGYLPTSFSPLPSPEKERQKEAKIGRRKTGEKLRVCQKRQYSFHFCAQFRSLKLRVNPPPSGRIAHIFRGGGGVRLNSPPFLCKKGAPCRRCEFAGLFALHRERKLPFQTLKPSTFFLFPTKIA